METNERKRVNLALSDIISKVFFGVLLFGPVFTGTMVAMQQEDAPITSSTVYLNRHSREGDEETHQNKFKHHKSCLQNQLFKKSRRRPETFLALPPLPAFTQQQPSHFVTILKEAVQTQKQLRLPRIKKKH